MMKQKAFALLGFFTVLVMALSMVSASNGFSLEIVTGLPAIVNVGQDYNVQVKFVNQNDTYDAVNVSLQNNTNGDWIFLDANSSVDKNTNQTFNATLKIPSNFVDSSGKQLKANYYNGTDYISYVAATFYSTLNTTVVLPGCTDSSANNYNSSANTDDGSCTYDSTINDTQVCKYGVNGSNLLSINDWSDESDVDDEWTWKLLDDISIDVEVENTGDDDNEDYLVSLLFFDSSGKDVTGDFVDDEDNLEVDVNNLDSDDDTTVTLDFTLDGDVEEGDYIMVIKLIKDGKEREQCVYESTQDISIEQEDNQVIVKNVDSEKNVKAGETLSLDVEVANIGSDDEDRVKVILYNKDLGLNLYKEVDNLDSGDKATVTFLVTIPSTAKQGTYRLTFSTEFEYDEDDEEYNTESETDDDLTYSITVFGMTTAPTIGAKLISDAKVGRELSINLSITNNGDADETYDLIVEGTSWAKNVELDDSTVIVRAGETKNVVLKLLPTESGVQDFTVKAVYGDEVKRQTVSVKVDSSTGFLTGAFAGVGTMGYLIAAIILVAILILIVAIIKLATRPKRRVESIAY